MLALSTNHPHHFIITRRFNFTMAHYSPLPCPFFPFSFSSPGTYADVYWIKEAVFDESDDFAALISAGSSQVGDRSDGRALPRYNCTA